MTEYHGQSAYETYVGDNPPTTTQLFRLAALTMSSVNAKQCSREKPRVHLRYKEICHHNDVADALHHDRPAKIRHRMAVRIGRRMLGDIPMKEWSLKWYDTRSYQQLDGEWINERMYYGFEWARSTVTRAERKLIVPSQTQQVDLYDYLDRVPIRDDTPYFLGSELEMSQVTAEDCDELIADVADYYEQTDALLRRGAA